MVLEKILHMKYNLMVLSQNLAKIINLLLTANVGTAVHVSEADSFLVLKIMTEVFLLSDEVRDQ